MGIVVFVLWAIPIFCSFKIVRFFFERRGRVPKKVKLPKEQSVEIWFWAKVASLAYLLLSMGVAGIYQYST